MDLSVLNSPSWTSFESNLENISDNKAKGDLFEYFSYFYLKYHASFYGIKEIYCPIVDGHNFPRNILHKLQLEKKDNGVDGVYIDNEGKYTAWQAKFRSNRSSLTSRELSTFWAEAEYADNRLIISNSRKLPSVADKKFNHSSILIDRLKETDSNYFKSFYHYFTSKDKVILKEKSKPRDYQKKIIKDIQHGFCQSDKGKVIAACGIGKTLISLWSAENLAAKKVVFFAPSLQLVRQTLKEWSVEALEQFSYICVCSDQTVDSGLDQNNITLSEMDIPVSTDSAEIVKFLSSKGCDDYVYVFSTYQSAKVIGDALNQIDGWTFDLAIYDEAHRTAGIGEKHLFSAALLDHVIPTRKKLFLTATERLLRPKTDYGTDIPVFSMNDETIYGPVFSRLSFGEAIEKNIISDYRIVVSGISNSEIEKVISQNLYIKDEFSENSEEEAAQKLFKRIILKKSIFELGIRKVVSFHSSISDAKLLSRQLQMDIHAYDNEQISISHINGSMSAQERSEIIQDFEDADISVITNVRCLTEGINIPIMDGVFFADPKGSSIDIVQAVGRALRQPFGEVGKLAYIIIPILIDENSNDFTSGQDFESLFNLIQALRDQDYAINEWINFINSSATKGKRNFKSNLGKIELRIPREVNYDYFETELALKIADVIRDPNGTIGIGSKLGKSERKGNTPRVFKTIMDYTLSSCYKSLVIPTLALMEPGLTYKGKDIKKNNNNISHCRRLGLITEAPKKIFKISHIGIQLKNKKIEFKDIFKNQMLLYSSDGKEGTLYPYREAFKFFESIESVGYIQFAYSLYSLRFKDNGQPDLDRAIKIAKDIDIHYPEVHLANKSNQQSILNELNAKYDSELSFEDVWTDRTTVGNQYRYLTRHLELFEEIFVFSNDRLQVKSGRKSKIDEILFKTNNLLDSKNYGESIWIL